MTTFTASIRLTRLWNLPARLAIDQVRDVENNVAPLKAEDTFARLTKFGERFRIETAA